MSEQEIKVLAMEIYMAVISGCNVQDIEIILREISEEVQKDG